VRWPISLSAGLRGGTPPRHPFHHQYPIRLTIDIIPNFFYIRGNLLCLYGPHSLSGAVTRQKLNLHIVLFAVSLFQPNWTLGVGLPDQWERAVFVIETRRTPGWACGPRSKQTASQTEEDGQPEFCPAATGFRMEICGKVVRVSNRHVVEARTNVFIRAERKSGGLLRLPVGMLWRAHPNPKIDLAASLISLPHGVKTEDLHLPLFSEDADRRAAEPTSCFLDLPQLRAGDEIFTMGFPGLIPGIRDILKTHGEPLLRAGVISLILPSAIKIADREYADIFLVDSWSFQGNSGSLVFWKPAVQQYSDRGFRINRPYIVGVVSAFLNWDANIQLTAQPSLVASTNAGLSIIQAASGIATTVAQFPDAVCVPRAQTSQELPAKFITQLLWDRE
jgi:hypothetical protein